MPMSAFRKLGLGEVAQLLFHLNWQTDRSNTRVQ